MDAETIKVECLKLAAGKVDQPDAAKIVETADALWRWVTTGPFSSDQTPARPEGTADKS